MNRKINLGILWTIIGLVLISLSCFEIIDSEVYVGFAGGLIAVGICNMFVGIRLKKDKDYKEKVEIEINDERNKYLRLKAWAIAGYSYVITTGIIVIVLMVLKEMLVMKVLSYTICFIVFVYWLAYAIYSRKE